MDILAETIKGFNGFTAQSTINNSAYYNSEEDDTESNPNIDPKLATYTSDVKKRKATNNDTTNRNSPRKLLINRLIPEIIPVTISPIDKRITEDAAGSGENLHAPYNYLEGDCHRCGAQPCVCFWTLTNVSRNDTDETTPW